MTILTSAEPKVFFVGSNRFASLKPTVVFDTYWRFAAERQRIYFARLNNEPQPWTGDPVLRRHRFTNAYRVADRVSQFLISHVIYGSRDLQSYQDIVFRILLFKVFNKIDTWELLENELGYLSWQTFDLERYDRVLTAALHYGGKIYSGAYIMPPVKLGPADGVKHRGHLALLDLILRDDFARKCMDAKTLQEVFLLLKSYPSIGNFLGFQLAIDINYSDITDHSEADFVVAGPGALDGISKCFENAGEFEPSEIIALMMDRQEQEFERLGIEFKTLFGRRLQLIDCQNIFCEISKYARVAHPEFEGVAGRTRIKQEFRCAGDIPAPVFPRKWKLSLDGSQRSATTTAAADNVL